ncbi:MAG: PIG-L deacetylase family protein [Candidatus Helarchaeota archaeon]
MKVLFFSPHPDDIEFSCVSTEIELVNNGHNVIMACYTADEYGTDRNDFKGERISRIRRREMREAAKVVGINKLYWIGYIDGYSRFDKESIKIIKNFILKIKPDAIFAPDPFYTIDRHIDHINLAKTVYYVWKHLKKKPLYLLYYTYLPNYYIPARNRKKGVIAFKKHVSQGFANPLFIYFSWFLKFFYGIFTPHAIFSEAFRIVNYSIIKKNKNPIKMPRIIIYFGRRLFRSIFKNILPREDLYRPTPQELGLKEFRFDIEQSVI